MPVSFTTRAPVGGRRGAIATSSYLATETGMSVLRRGGNCVDAAIAAAAVLNVVEPHCSHLGGDCFMLVWDARRQTLTAINSSGAAPGGLRAEVFPKGIPESGFLSSTIPGQVAGWDLALSSFGTWSPAQVLAEAIYYAEEGAPVSRDLAAALHASLGRLSLFPSSMASFMPGCKPPQRGEVLRQPGVAVTLKTMAQEGFRAFYEGDIARRIAAFWQNSGGVISEEDLAAHHALALEPLRVSYRGYEVFEQPPVSQGHILLQSMKLAETFDLRGMGLLSAEALHLSIEANKLAHADKNRYTTDPRYHALPAGLLSDRYAADRAALIDMGKAASFPPPAGDPPTANDTTYLCCADGMGNAISYIQSVFHGFGCGVVAGDTGVLLNNRACGFSLDPEHVNYLEPGKKTVHTLNTYMVFSDGRPCIVGGTPGGDIQVQTNLQVLTGVLDFDLNPQQAVEMPRWSRHEGLSIGLEARAPGDVFRGLTARGHRLTTLGPYSQGGRAQVIRVGGDGVLTAGSDPRCDGCALAF